MKTIKTWLKRAAMLSVTVAFAAAGFRANAATSLTLNDGDTLTGTYADHYATVAAGATITLDGVSITNSADGVSVIHCLGDATIILAPGSENTIVGTVGRYCVGNAIYVPTNSTLTIRGSGSLYADSSRSDYRNAAIGAFSYPYNDDYIFPCGDIVIEGGTITAKGGAAIGASGSGGYCGNITITGDANVTAIATSNTSAGIGAAGTDGNCGNITISGNASVTATGKYHGPGIGAADHSTCGNIVISTTGTVTSTGDYYAPGIGAPGVFEGCKCGDITITSGTVIATGSNHSPGIGTDYYYERSGVCGSITIADRITMVSAHGMDDSPGIYRPEDSAPYFTCGSHLDLVKSDSDRLYTLTPHYTEISDVTGFNAIANDLSGFYRLTADIDLENVQRVPFGEFSGVLDGNGHAIRNLNIRRTAVGYGTALFQTLKDGAVVRNLALEGGTVRSDSYQYPMGGIAGYVHGNGVLIEGCTVDLDIAGSDQVGGIVGYAEYAGSLTIRRCRSFANVTSTGNNAGGILGKLYDMTVLIEDSYSCGKIAANSNAGGLVGALSSNRLTINNCYQKSDITGNTRNDRKLVGEGDNWATITGNPTVIDTLPKGGVRVSTTGAGTGTAVFENGEIVATAAPGSFVAAQLGEVPSGEFNDVKVQVVFGKEIATVADLNAVANDLSGIYRLTADLDLNNVARSPFGEFKGLFDGGGHTISNVNISANSDNVGLFRGLNCATVRNLSIRGGRISGGSSVGGLAGYATGTSNLIEDCTTDLEVVASGSHAGGVVGYVGDRSAALTLRRCRSLCAVSYGSSHGGGLVGSKYGDYSNLTVESCYAAGSVQGGSNAGGILGQRMWGTVVISNSYWTTEVHGNYNNDTHTVGYGEDSSTIRGTPTILDGFPKNIVNVRTRGNGTGTASYNPATGEFTATPDVGSVFYGWEGLPPKDGDYNETTVWAVFGNPVASLADLRAMELGGYYVQTADIELADVANFTGVGFGGYGNTAFRGYYDGGNHEIRNMTIANERGLFRTGVEYSEIRNLRIVDACVTNGNYSASGVLAPDSSYTTLSNVHVVGGSVTATRDRDVGGFVGSISSGMVEDCSSSATVTGGTGQTGGFAGSCSATMMRRCRATGAVTASGSTVGGFVGNAGGNGAISECYASGDVTAGNQNAGGFVGYDKGGAKISDCYALGAVCATNGYAGGFIGYGYMVTCTNCFSVGEATADSGNVGGFGTNNYLVKFNGSCWDTETSGLDTASGAGDVGRTTAEMKSGVAFEGWDETVWKFSEGQYPRLRAFIPKYAVTWLDEDGTTVLGEAQVEEFDTPVYGGETPAKAATPKYTYTFAGWDPEVAAVTGEATYTATYDAKINEYTITWKNDDGTVIDSEDVAYDETPTHADPTKASTAQYHYEFAGWDPEVASVTGEATYTATFNSILRSYTITWKDDAGAVIDTTTVNYGDTPSHAAPTKASTAQYDYTFAGWGDVVAVTGEATYQATFTPVLRSYTITWLNDDNSLIGTTTVAYGTTPTHAAPTKAETAEYTYTFAGWSPAIASVSGDATYTAQFNSTKRSYTVSWVVEGETVASGAVEYGETPVFGGETPVKESTAEYSYAFTGWSPAIAAVTGEATYTAQFDATKRSYTITWANIDGAGASATSTVEYGTVPAYGGATPTKAETAEYTYTFAGWDKAVVAVTGAATYTATFDATPKEPEDEFAGYVKIGDVAGFEAIANNLATNYVLMADIDLQNVERQPFGEFSGVFDGNGHSVKNISITKGSDTYIGLFSKLNGATIRNLTLDGGRIEGYDNVGGIAGEILGDTLIEDCTVNLVVFGNRYTIGGLVGHAYGGNVTIRRCRGFADVTSRSGESGGLVGVTNSDNLRIEDSYAEGILVARNQTYCGGYNGYSGGLVGLKDRGSLTISNCYHRATMVDNGFNDRQLVGNGDGKATIIGEPTVIDSLPKGGIVAFLADSNGSGTVAYVDGEVVATPDEGSVFIRWEGEIPEGSNFNDVRALAIFGKDVATAEDLQSVGDTGYYVQTADIDMSGVTGFGGIGASGFSGEYDGRGHEIRNLSIDNNVERVGLFRTLRNATLRNIRIVGGFVKGYRFVGALAGFIDGGGALIENCSSTADVNATIDAGGLVGNAYDATIRQCYAAGNVTSSGSVAGGFINWCEGLIIEDCYALGKVNAGSELGGGFIACSEPSTYRTVTVLTNCYSVGAVTVTGSGNVGGFTARDDNRTNYGCYWDKETSGRTTSYGVGVTGLTTAQMKSDVPFAGWDTSVWKFTEGLYPRLRAFIPKYTVTWLDEDGVTVLDEAQVDEFDTPVYGGATPTKAETAEYTYTFAGWAPAVAAVESNTTYTATFDATPKTPEEEGLDQDVEGYYLLGSAQDWIDFAELVKTAPAANARMTTDIDLGNDLTMIGTSSVAYQGVFDGQGKTLTVNYSSSVGGIAPFQYVGAATIMNLHMDGRIATSACAAGGIAGAIKGSLTVSNCWVSASISAATSGDARGTIGGIASYCNTYYCDILIADCLFTGAITNNTEYCAGFMSNLGSNTHATMRNCLNAGTFPTSTSGCGTFSRDTYYCTLENCLYKTAFGSAQGTLATAEDLADGTTAAALQAGRDATVWVQDAQSAQPILATFYTVPEIPEVVVDLSTLTDNYTAQDGDTLTGATGYEITIAAGATVTLDGVAITNTTSSAPAVKCLGDATIVLAEGSDNSVVNMVDHYSAIYPSMNATLTIQGSGSLHVAAPGTSFKNYCAAIGSYSGGSSNTGTPCGNIVISGGNITAVGGYCGAGVGACSYDAACGDITITGDAVVHATGGAWAAGIGAASDRSPCGNITISGNASVTATSTAYSDANSAGIGAGYDSTCGDITISTTGTVEAQGVLAAGIGAGGYFGAACAGITITSGIITATGGGDACAIGASFKAGCGDILIEGGTITATGGEDCPGVGALGETASITITGGNVTAIGGSNGSRRNGGAGIGSMYYRTCGNITISGGTVTATGGAWAAGIGSGYEGTCSNITISAGMVTANVCTSTGDGETDTVAIGAGCRGTCGNILISGGTVVANATNPQNASKDNSSAIGATYYNSKCGDITITDGITSVTATKGAAAQQHIGQGDGDATIGTVTISPRLAQSLSNNDLTLTLTPQDVPETVTVTWKNEDGTTLETDTVAYGATPTYDGAMPTKSADAQYTYTFEGWTPAVVAATSNTTYTATFSSALNEYVISWDTDGNGEVDDTTTVAYGTVPTHADGSKAADAQYTYTFEGWTPAVVAATADATYTATFSSALNEYVISWDTDGNGEVDDTTTVAYGTVPTHADGSKAADAQYTYTFTGWDTTPVAVTGPATYTATFNATVNEYTISWDTDGNGEVDDTATVAYGTVPTHADGSKAATAQYTYTFTGWDTALVAVTGPATYTATFSETVNEYEISWVVEGVTVASGSVEYGTTPAYGGATPTKAETAEYSYAFSGWSPTISAVTGEATYTAQFEATKRSYTVSWVVEGVTVASGSVEYGTTPTYGGATPTKAETEEYTYTFNGWTPAVVAVTGNATYTATFTATPKEPDDPDEPYDGTETIGGVTWNYTIADGEATITGAQFAEGTITIPETVNDGVHVVAIEPSVLADNQDITEVTISRYVVRIGADVGVKSDDWAQNLEEAGFDGSYPAFGNCESLLNYRVDANNEVFEEIGGALYYRDTPASAKELALYPSGRSTLYFADGLTVTKIGDGACAWCHKFTELTIPASVREIGVRSFDFCREIVTLTIPATVTDIGWGAFLMNIALENADINGADLAIGDYAFYHSFMADNKGNLVIRGGVKEVGFNAFCHSMHLGAVVMEDGVTNIAMNAFSQCYDLAALTLPGTLKTIGAGAFCGCGDLRELIVPLSVEGIGLSQPDDGSDGGAFAGCSGLTRIYVPLSLKPATEGETQTYLAAVFEGLGLEDMDESERSEILTWYSDPSEIGGGDAPDEPDEFRILVDKNDPTTVTGFEGTCPATITAADWPEGVECIDENAFNGCTNLQHLTFPAGIKKIGRYSFRNCDALETVDFSNCFDTLKSIGMDSFNGCTSLRSLDIDGDSLVISFGAFYACTSLTSLRLGSGVSQVYEYAFGASRALAEVTIVSPETLVGGAAFIGTAYYKNMPFAFIVKEDWEGTRFVAGFKGVCPENIAASDWPEGVEYIDVRTFPFTDELRSVEFPASFTGIYSGSFACCTNLESITFPVNNSASGRHLFVGDNAFAICTKLRSVTLRGALTISDDAFAGCTRLETVVVEEGVNFWGERLFARTGVRSIVLPENVENVSAGAFAGNDGDFTVHVPRSVVDNYGLEEGIVECDSYIPNVPGFETEARWAEYGFTYQETTTNLRVVPYGDEPEKPELPFTTDGDAKWTVDVDGSWRSGAIGNSQSTWAETNVVGSCIVSFKWKVSSEESFDKLKLLVDDDEKMTISGTKDWKEVILPLSDSGEHTIRWSYAKDSSESRGDDCGWVKDFQVMELVTVPIRTGGDAEWFVDPNGNWRSGVIDAYQTTWAETTVTGPCRVNFRWKTSSEEDYNRLTLIVDGTERDAISGVMGDWEAKTLKFQDSRNHVIRWSYSKNTYAYECEDCGWVKGFSVETLPIEDFTFTVEWLDWDGCELETDENVAYGATPEYNGELPERPNDYRYSYSFTGWTPTLTSVTEDATYTAVYLARRLGEETEIIDGIAWSYIVDGDEAMITKASPVTGCLTIPASVSDGITVTAIDDDAFNDCDNLTSVVIPEGVERIGERAFYGCAKLESVEFPATVESIGWMAFAYCRKLATVTFNGNIDDIDFDSGVNYTFEGTPWAANIPFKLEMDGTCVVGYSGRMNGKISFADWPAEATSIAEWAFGWEYGLLDVEIPATIVEIGNNAFNGCENITNLVFEAEGEAPLAIGEWAFGNLLKLETVVLPARLASLASGSFGQDEKLADVQFLGEGADVAKDAFVRTPYLLTLDFRMFVDEDGIAYFVQGTPPDDMSASDWPTGLSGIADNLFFCNTNLASVVIPKSVTNVAYQAFYGCTALTNVVFEAVGAGEDVLPLAIMDSAFYECANLASVTFREGISSIKDGAFYGCTALATVNFPGGSEDGVDIGNFAFARTAYDAGKDFEFIVLSHSVTGFHGTCPAIIRAEDWPDGVVAIASSAFSECSTLEQVTLPTGITDIYWQAFHGCENLGAVNFANSFDTLKTIDREAFSGCTSLETVELDGKDLMIDEGAFEGCTGLTALTIREGVSSIQDFAFSNCRKLEAFVNNSYADIAETAFIGTEYYRNMDFKFIKRLCWEGGWEIVGHKGECPAQINAADWPEDTTVIYRRSFTFDDDLRAVEFPASLRRIDESAFACCTNLVSLTFPQDGSLAIDHNAFALCTKLQNITLRGDLMVCPDAFAGCSSLETVRIEEGVYELDEGAFARTQVSSIVLPEGMDEVSAHAFAYDDGDFTVYVPRSETSMYGLSNGDVTYEYMPRIFGLETEEGWARYGLVVRATTANLHVVPYCRVTLDLAGGTGVATSQLGTGETVNDQFAHPVKAGFAFAGWTSARVAEITNDTTWTAIIGSATGMEATLTALWTPNETPEPPEIVVEDQELKDKLDDPVVDEDTGIRTIKPKDDQTTLTQEDADKIEIVSPLDGVTRITGAYVRTCSWQINAIVISLATPKVEPVVVEENKDEEDATGLLEDVDKVDDGKIAAKPEPDVSDPEPEKHEEVGALPVKMYPGLYYQASWGDDLNNLTPGAKFRADGSQTHIGVIKQTGSRGFYKISVSER